MRKSQGSDNSQTRVTQIIHNPSRHPINDCCLIIACYTGCSNYAGDADADATRIKHQRDGLSSLISLLPYFDCQPIKDNHRCSIKQSLAPHRHYYISTILIRKDYPWKRTFFKNRSDAPPCDYYCFSPEGLSLEKDVLISFFVRNVLVEVSDPR